MWELAALPHTWMQYDINGRTIVLYKFKSVSLLKYFLALIITPIPLDIFRTTWLVWLHQFSSSSSMTPKNLALST